MSRLLRHLGRGTDPLTGLNTPRRFHEALAARLAAAERDDAPQLLAVFDLDDFRAVNAARGHAFGDDVLREVAATLRRSAPRGALLARLGGDRFVFAAPGGDVVAAELARAALERIVIGDHKVGCTAAVAMFPSDARDAHELVRLAESALASAKLGSRGRTRRHAAGDVALAADPSRRLVEEILEEAHGIRPAFQPIVRLADGALAGYEALSRFPSRERQSPSWWFEQAHRCGLGVELESAAIRAVLAEDGRPDGVFMSFNVSVSALLAPELQDSLPDDLTQLVVEITEHEQVPDEPGLQVALGALRARGARIAVDDTGAGYAGLQQIMRIGADIIKLDRELVDGIADAPVKRALAQSLVGFTASTGAELCAEGIERLEDLRLLADLGVTYGQGYVIARPAHEWPAIPPEIRRTCREQRSGRVVGLDRRRAARAATDAAG
jgi:diguanylate cyclase (GGDEF)-like protein